MAKDKKDKQGLLKRLMNLVSNKDEKEAAEKAKAELEAAAIEQEKDDAAKVRYTHAVKQVEDIEEKVRNARVEEWREKMRKRAAGEEELKIMKEHTVKEGETLSHVALKYYGFATEPYWRIILDANESMGGNEKRVYPGLVLKVPELPEDFREEAE